MTLRRSIGRAFWLACVLVVLDVRADDTAPKTPAHAFASGRLFLSIDDAFPLVSVGGTEPRSGRNALKLGDPAGPGTPAHPIPVALDIGLAAGVTLGASILTEHEISTTTAGARAGPRERTHYTVFAARAGWLFPIARSFAVWPRVGGSWTRFAERLGLEERFDLRFDASLALVPKPAWAVVVGPSVAIPVGQDGTQSPSLEPRVALTAGLVGRIDARRGARTEDGAEDEPPAVPRVLVGVEQVVPLLRYDLVQGDSVSTDGLPSTFTMHSLSAGTVDSKRSSPTSLARAALDVRVWEGLTVGAAFALGWLRSGSGGTLDPGMNARPAFALSTSPRAGWLARISRIVLVWPRAGITYSRTDVDRPEVGWLTSYHLAIDFGVPFIFEIARDFGITLSPDIAIPVVGEDHVVGRSPPVTALTPATARAVDASFLSAGLSGGFVALF